MKKTITSLARGGLPILLAMFLGISVFAQTKKITGKVTDATDNAPLPGVTVSAKGTTIATQTTADGSFSLDVPQSARTLVFSFVGHQTREVEIGSSATVNVSLSTAARSLEDVVVVGYGTQKRKEVTAAVATVKAEDFNQGGVRSPLDLIQGKVAGLSITRTQGNNPNAGAAIQLRGVTSLAGSIAPLIVIDGIPGGNLDLLQQDDIESFDVLKDGSAAAIYGTRANGGVILITTKKGRAGDPQFNYSAYVQREAIAKRPEVLSPEEYLDIPSATDLGSRTNMYDLLIDKENISHYHNFSATGGSAKSNYRAAIYYNDAYGIAIRNSRKQYGGRLNINQRGMQDHFTLQLNLAANFNKADLLGGSTGDFEQSIQRNPTAAVFNPNGTYLETNAFNNYNPLARLSQELSERDQQTISGDFRAILELVKGLRLSAFGAIVRNTWNDRQYRLKASRSSQQTYAGGGYAAKSNFLAIDRTLEFTADYARNIGDDHSITAIVGYSYQYSTAEGFNVNNNGFITDAFQDWNMGSGNAIRNTLLPAPGIGSSKEDNTLIAFFGRINYAYKGKYLAQFILRHEGSSRFGANNKWGNFPAASVGWMISEEPFMKNVEFVNNVKLRVGYGVTGNQGIPNYQSLVTLSTGGFYLQDGVWFQTYGPSRNPNPELRWEKKSELNIGLDFSILDNRIGGAIDVYNRKTEDLLFGYNAQQPPFVLSTLFTNVGTITSKGVEVLLNIVPIRSSKLTWNVDLTFNAVNNKLTSIANDLYKVDRLEFGGLPSPGNLGNAIRVVEGGRIGNFYGKRFAGFTDNGKWLFYKKDGSTAEAGGINNEDLTIIGNSVPRFMGSITSFLKYKNFDLTVFFRGKFGYDILNTQEMYFGNKRWSPNNMLRSVLTRHGELDDVPQYSDYYLESGSFVKLDNLTIGYTIPLKTVYIRNLRVYASGRNIATITGYSGLDPELEDTGFTTGIDSRGFYPRTMSFALGLNVGF